ncbi:unnamed protein product [Linum tenue]|uniref:Uncharacterized protein n=1 Tax=Linum tenue TaxID=586396 RepID=A0AAV0J5G0_9ROSI|nr:unnamed protein product [Linum tenue]
MAESTRRLPSWMLATPPPAASSDAAEQQPKTNTSKGGHLKVSPRNGNAKKRKKANRDETAVSQTTPCGDGVVEPPGDDRLLTVQDLVAIAEEYVRAANDVGSEKNPSIKGECRSRAVSSGIDLQGGVTVNKHNSPAASCSSMQKSTAEQIPVTVSTTGDPAHDMLHLFLGPLLTKPVTNEKNDVSSRMDLDFAFDAMRHSHNHVEAAAVPPPLKEKKKSSLRDKVSGLTKEIWADF